MNLAGPIGTIAAISTTAAFLPQIWKIKRQGGEDLSYPMLFVYLFGIVLWLVYGILLHAAAVIWANAATAVLVGIAIALKASKARESGARRLREASLVQASHD
jgi:MtN3 and saliva related transmembrane protein